MALAQPILRLIKELTKLPGVGEKTASRLAMYIIRSSPEDVENLVRALREVKEKIHLCSRCFNLTEQDPCAICADPRRDNKIICVVSSPEDLMAIEKSRSFHGIYHVLHGVLSPLDGIGPQDLKIQELLTRLPQEKIAEVILATNPSAEGEATAQYLAQLIKPLSIKITRIARGVPMGGDLQYIDEVTLGKSLENRVPF